MKTLPEQADAAGRIHTDFRQDVAATGRLSSNDPNLQNIPIRPELGRQIRDAFVPEKGNVFVSADYSQFELRLAAVLAGDENMINYFNAGTDIHTKTAAEVYHVSLDAVTKEQRRKAKVVNFGVLYGICLLYTSETLVRCSFGMRTIRLRQHSDPSDRMEPGGDFLEEACAEEAASRWREWMEPTRKYVTQEHTHAMGDEPPLPWRYLNTDVGLYWGSRDADIVWCGYSWSAYCAEAIRLIGEHTGEDIFALMVEARDPVKEAEAKRKIVRTIDSVEPGLYKKLRDLQYSREAFIEGYELVVGALKRARSRDELREVA